MAARKNKTLTTKVEWRRTFPAFHDQMLTPIMSVLSESGRHLEDGRGFGEIMFY